MLILPAKDAKGALTNTMSWTAHHGCPAGGGSMAVWRDRRADLGLALMSRRFPPPWSVEETDACFIVRDASGQALAYVYFEEEPGRRAAAKLLTRDEARRIPANVAKLPGLFAPWLIRPCRRVRPLKRQREPPIVPCLGGAPLTCSLALQQSSVILCRASQTFLHKRLSFVQQ